MRVRPLAVTAFAFFFVSALAQERKKEPALPAVFGTAHYVYVQPGYPGAPNEKCDNWQAKPVPEDIPVVRDTEDAIEDWGRYEVTTDRYKAELVFMVRKVPPGTSMAYDGLAVCTAKDGQFSTPIWFREMPDGMEGPRLPLLEMLRKEIEKEYPRQREHDH